jgi:hypothetical protein
MGGKIFISYRREDDPSAAARVRDALAARFGKASLFMDVDSLAAGQRFDEQLAKALTACDVFIAIIGPRWVDLLRSKSQMSGLRDYVREEIAFALKRKIVVVPVRVGSEHNLLPVPRAKDLPSDIRDLVYYQKHDIVHEHFARDIAGLVEAITRVRGSTRTKRIFPWEASAAALIGLSVSVLIYLLQANLKMISTPAAQAQTTESAPRVSEALERAQAERRRREQAEREAAAERERAQAESRRREQSERDAAERERAQAESRRREQAEREAAERQLDELSRRGEAAMKVLLTTLPDGMIRWSVQNSTSRTLRVHFASQDRIAFWPGNGNPWTLAPGQRTYMNLRGKVGEKVCYGAFREDGSKSWGVGRSGKERCKHCCITIEAGSHSASNNLVE